MWKYILEKSIESNKANNLQNLKDVGKVVWEFLSAIYKACWDSLSVDNSNTSFRNKVKSKFNPQANKPQTTNKVKKMAKPIFISALSSSIPAKLSKKVNKLSKYFKKNKKQGQKKSYAQALASANLSSKPKMISSNVVLKTLKIKETFPYFHNKKIDQVQKIISGTNNKPKLQLNITTRGLSQKQVIILMTKDMANQFIKDSSMHVININYALKGLKLSIIANFIHVEDKGIVITTNNIASSSDLQEIEKYIKNLFTTDANQVTSPRLSQSKSYLKIVSISFISKWSNMRISSEEVKNILKSNHIFNDIILASKPRIIKVSPKSNMAIIWIDIWNTQSGSNVMKIINRHFNIGSFIAMVQGANINLGVPQYKNCWK